MSVYVVFDSVIGFSSKNEVKMHDNYIKIAEISNKVHENYIKIAEISNKVHGKLHKNSRN